MKELLRPLPIRDQAPPADEMLAEILQGLESPDRHLPSRYLYDELGAELFEVICEQAEYYIPRTELAIMRQALPELAARVGQRAMVFEPGSGAGAKTRLLLQSLDKPSTYVPIDISREQLIATTLQLRRDFPEIEILPVCADFLREFELPVTTRRVDCTIAYFPGSTIGNVVPAEAVGLLRRLRHACGRQGAILIGVDLIKDPRVLERAYDDGAGVSAGFAFNYLLRLNQEFQANFDPSSFKYTAIYDDRLSRIEMYLESLRDQTVGLAGRHVKLDAGARIRTEVSYKYSRESFAAVAALAGLVVERVWTDPKEYFSVQLLTSA